VVTAVIANGAGQGLAFTRDFTITATGGSQIPGVPTSLSASPSGSGVSLAWNSVNGASYYRVYRSNSASGSYSQIGGSVYGASYTDSGLSAGTYYYKVSAISSSGIEGGQSGYVSAVVTATVPGAPTGLYTSVSENNVYLTWNSVGGASYYRVYRSNSAFGSYSQIGGSVYGASYTDSGLSAGT
jgi:fibronectin type 3 domain-containing protein